VRQDIFGEMAEPVRRRRGGGGHGCHAWIEIEFGLGINRKAARAGLRLHSDDSQNDSVSDQPNGLS
jgi:hypothetical protein